MLYFLKEIFIMFYKPKKILEILPQQIIIYIFLRLKKPKLKSKNTIYININTKKALLLKLGTRSISVDCNSASLGLSNKRSGVGGPPLSRVDPNRLLLLRTSSHHQQRLGGEKSHRSSSNKGGSYSRLERLIESFQSGATALSLTGTKYAQSNLFDLAFVVVVVVFYVLVTDFGVFCCCC